MKKYVTLASLAYLLSLSSGAYADKYEYNGKKGSHGHHGKYDRNHYDHKSSPKHHKGKKHKKGKRHDRSFQCKTHIDELSVVYNGDTPIDIVVYNGKKRGSVLHTFPTVEKGDLLEVGGLEDAKKEMVWKLYELGTNNEVGQSYFNLQCTDKDMDKPSDCGNEVGDGNSKHGYKRHGKKGHGKNRYVTDWLFNGLTDKRGNSFRCDLPETNGVPPELVLLGSSTIALEIGDDYIDPGAEATDDLDGDLTSLIVTDSNLNTLAIGSYTITYSVTDFDGNTSTAIRNVNVSDENSIINTVQTRVADSSDDAEQENDGRVWLISSDLELPYDDVDLNTKTVGIRFVNLDIPEDATISNAYIQFQTDEVSYGNSNINIRAEKSKYSAPIVQAHNNISSRDKTDTVVSWSPAPWETVGEAGENQRTPNLSPVIQEVLSGPGNINSISFIIDGEGKRTAESYDGDPSGAPLLFIEYATEGTTISTVTVSPNIKRVLPVNALDYEVVNAPDKGSLEINEETGDYVYKSTAEALGSDVVKFKPTDTSPETETSIVNINLTPAPVMLNGAELANFSSNLPLLILDTNSNTIPDEPKIKGVLTVIPPGDTGRSTLLGTPEYSDFMEVELRGTSSQQYPKKNFGLDTETFDGEDNDVSILGMPEEHKWVLHGPYTDKTLMRNYIAYNKTRDMGGYGAVRTKYVEVLLQEGDSYSYHGVYVFMEKIKRDKNRLDIAKLKSDETELPDITGGYIMKQDREDDDWFFNTDVKDSKIVMDYPKAEDLNDQQKDYIQAYMNSFETALFDDNFGDPANENYYGNFIEADSFAKHLLSRELFRDVDTWSFSEYFHKDKDGKLSMLPVWDFNLGMGNANYSYFGSTEGWNFNWKVNGTGGWLKRLMSDPAFKADVRAKWEGLRAGQWSDENLNKFIDDTKDLLRESQERNFERWPVLGTFVWPNRPACDGGTAYCDTWDKAVDEHLRVWLLARAAWMDATLAE